MPDAYDFLARKLHSAQGRWISPDPAGLDAADPTNPQSWNLHAYVLNSPLIAVDPDGLDSISGVPSCNNPQIRALCQAGITTGYQNFSTWDGLAGVETAWDPPSGWADPGAGDTDLINAGAKFNPVTDEIWYPTNPLNLDGGSGS